MSWKYNICLEFSYAVLQNKQILIDAVVHAVNEDYVEMENYFTRLGFLASGTDVSPIIPVLEAIWQNSSRKGLSDFNFRSVTGKFNKLVYQYPIRIPERFSLVIHSLLTQEGICFTLKPDFKFLEVRMDIFSFFSWRPLSSLGLQT
ncbi:hypothetical protein NE237_015822 [Protea cynaroides]|uniref:Uncharacterized protein n=1 Tax=Protea cynaroides TaxID=273540 RepID=A0A9Q0KF15_9MAGN|nr:hypothetical protein NE237_015822 [Protea cynaroides]